MRSVGSVLCCQLSVVADVDGGEDEGCQGEEQDDHGDPLIGIWV